MFKTEGKILYRHSFHPARQYWYFPMPGVYCLNLDRESGKTKLTRIEQKMIFWAYWLSRKIINKIRVNLWRRWVLLLLLLFWSCLPTNISSVQLSRSVVSDSLWPHESQHANPPCPSQTPRVYSNSCPSSQWCHPAISSSAVPFSSCPQPLPASGSFPTS